MRLFWAWDGLDFTMAKQSFRQGGKSGGKAGSSVTGQGAGKALGRRAGRGEGERPADAVSREGASRAPRPFQVRPGSGRGQGQRLARATPELALIYGLHAVRAALTNPRRKLLRLHGTALGLEKLQAEIAQAKVVVQQVAIEDIAASLSADAVHQGVLLEARPLPVLDISEIEMRSGMILVLDQITDPHNVGAILRSAAAFALDAIVTTERHAPDFSGVLAKAASGGLEHVPIAEATNLARALTELGEMGYLRIGLDSEGAVALESVALHAPVALVLGAEGRGLRRLTRERCDVIAKLDLPGAVKSLNVSNACAIALALTHARLHPGA